MATASLRPLSIGEILDAALKVVIRHWKPLMLAVIVPILPLTVLSVLLTASLETDLSQFETSGDPADIEASFWVSAGLGSLVSYLTTFIVQAVCFKAVADAWLGAEPSAGRSWRFALQRTFALLAMVLLMLVTFLLGLIACGIPSIWLSVMWSVATAALLFERLGPIKALGRSFELIKQRFWATLLLLIITTLLTFFVTAVVQGIPSGLAAVFAPDNEIATAVTDIIFGTIGSAMVLPISAAVFAILYFDQRVRKEGFDVQLLAAGIGAEYDPNAPIPAPLRPDPNAAPPAGLGSPSSPAGLLAAAAPAGLAAPAAAVRRWLERARARRPAAALGPGRRPAAGRAPARRVAVDGP